MKIQDLNDVDTQSLSAKYIMLGPIFSPDDAEATAQRRWLNNGHSFEQICEVTKFISTTSMTVAEAGGFVRGLLDRSGATQEMRMNYFDNIALVGLTQWPVTAREFEHLKYIGELIGLEMLQTLEVLMKWMTTLNHSKNLYSPRPPIGVCASALLEFGIWERITFDELLERYQRICFLSSEDMVRGSGGSDEDVSAAKEKVERLGTQLDALREVWRLNRSFL